MKRQPREVILEFKQCGIEAIGVCFLFSYLHPRHELRMRELIEEHYPEAYVSLSHEVYPRWREYERASTTILDAFLKPSVHTYVHNLHEGLISNQIDTHLLMMKSNGGLTDYGSVARKPIDILISGPVGGGARGGARGPNDRPEEPHRHRYGGHQLRRQPDCKWSLQSFQRGRVGMGPPHSDRHGRRQDYWSRRRFAGLDRQRRAAPRGTTKRGSQSGACLLRTRRDPTDRHRCQPGAWADWTPIDSRVVKSRLDKAAAETAVGRYAEKLGLDQYETAHNIIQLVNWNMVNAIRLVSIDLGHDPRDFTLSAFGGAGSAHAAALAELMDIHEVLVPVHQGVLSAFGLTIADMRADVSQTANMRSDFLNLSTINATLEDLERRARDTIAREGYAGDPTVAKTIEMRYMGQNYGVEVAVPKVEDTLDDKDLAEIYRRFAAQHESLYGYSIPHEIIEFVNFHVTAHGSTHKCTLPRLRQGGTPSAMGSRDVFFSEKDGFVTCPIYWRDELAAGNTLEGPAVIEEDFSLTLLLPDQIMQVDDWGNLVIRTRKGRERNDFDG